MTSVLTYDIGPLEASELNLVFSSWAKTFRDANADNRRTPTNVYYRAQRDVIDSILRRYPTVIVARADGVVLGWLCGESLAVGNVVHACYVKSTYRRQGIAKALLSSFLESAPDAPCLYTHTADRWDDRIRALGLEPLHVEAALRAEVA